MEPLAPPKPLGRLNSKLIFWIVGTVGGLLLLGVCYLVYKQDYAPPAKPVAPPPAEVQSTTPTQDPTFPIAQRAGVNRLLGAQPASANIPTAQPYTAPLTPQQPAAAAFPPPPMLQQTQQDTPQQKEGTTGQPHGALPALQAQPTLPKRDKSAHSKYLFAPETNIAKSPFSSPDSQATSTLTTAPSVPGAVASSSSSLFKDAGTEIPDDPTRVWYMSQALSCVTTGAVNSDLPGQLVCRVDRALEDKFMAGVPLVPQHALLVMRPESAIDGFNRLSVSVRQIELQKGEVIPLTSKVSDQYGAGGVPANEVDRHLLSKFGGILATAILSVGVRVPAGNTEGYVPTMGQQVASQAGQELSRAGQEIVKKQFSRPDTLIIYPGTPMLIYPDTNISFSKPVKVVK